MQITYGEQIPHVKDTALCCSVLQCVAVCCSVYFADTPTRDSKFLEKTRSETVCCFDNPEFMDSASTKNQRTGVSVR